MFLVSVSSLRQCKNVITATKANVIFAVKLSQISVSKSYVFDCLISFDVPYSDTLNNNIDRKRTQLSQLQRQLSELEKNVHELKSQKVNKIVHKIISVVGLTLFNHDSDSAV